MQKEKKSTTKKIPALVITTVLIISGVFKIVGIHPMLDHFTAIGLSSVLIKFLGAAEVIFSILFSYRPTSKVGLLFLTAYFGGAIAAEIPYHQVAAPMAPLILVWIAAFIRRPSDFLAVLMGSTVNNPSTFTS
jgi:hypothetical protein